MISSCVAFFPFNIGWHDPGKVSDFTGTAWFLKVMLQRAVLLTFMGIELHECIFVVDGFNLSKMPHKYTCA